MKKLFIGIQVPRSLCEKFNALEVDIPGARWHKADNFHITLAYIGKADDDQVEKIAQALQEIKSTLFEIKTKGIGTFSKDGELNVVWIGVTHPDALVHIKSQVDDILRRHNLPLDEREYKPHITWAYLKSTDAELLNTFIRKNAGISEDAFTVSEITLYESTGEKETLQYKKIAAKQLKP